MECDYEGRKGREDGAWLRKISGFDVHPQSEAKILTSCFHSLLPSRPSRSPQFTISGLSVKLLRFFNRLPRPFGPDTPDFNCVGYDADNPVLMARVCGQVCMTREIVFASPIMGKKGCVIASAAFAGSILRSCHP